MTNNVMMESTQDNRQQQQQPRSSIVGESPSSQVPQPFTSTNQASQQQQQPITSKPDDNGTATLEHRPEMETTPTTNTAILTSGSETARPPLPPASDVTSVVEDGTAGSNSVATTVSTPPAMSAGPSIPTTTTQTPPSTTTQAQPATTVPSTPATTAPTPPAITTSTAPAPTRVILHQDDREDDADFSSEMLQFRSVEESPTGLYVRFNQKLGEGAFKKVYRAYDTHQGREVAWNQVKISALPKASRNRVLKEMTILQQLDHPNIIRFYASWLKKESETVVFITEMMTSGTLKQFIKNRPVRLHIVKRWCRHILSALDYLHKFSPPIIHRDLKCENIFINGGTGEIRIGDLGLASWERNGVAQSVLGTPEYMAPELYDENYDEKIDIYAFGMCVLEMITKETPYTECISAPQIFKKVTSGILPDLFNQMIESDAKSFIRRCILRTPDGRRPSAEELRQDPFLRKGGKDDDIDTSSLFVKDATAAAPPIRRDSTDGNYVIPKPPTIVKTTTDTFQDSTPPHASAREQLINTMMDRTESGSHDQIIYAAVAKNEPGDQAAANKPTNPSSSGSGAPAATPAREDAPPAGPKPTEVIQEKKPPPGKGLPVAPQRVVAQQTPDGGIVYHVGCAVEAKFHGVEPWYSGKIAARNQGGTYDIQYDDGDFETRVPGSLIRIPTQSSAKVPSSGGARRQAKLAGQSSESKQSTSNLAAAAEPKGTPGGASGGAQGTSRAASGSGTNVQRPAPPASHTQRPGSVGQSTSLKAPPATTGAPSRPSTAPTQKPPLPVNGSSVSAASKMETSGMAPNKSSSTSSGSGVALSAGKGTAPNGGGPGAAKPPLKSQSMASLPGRPDAEKVTGRSGKWSIFVFPTNNDSNILNLELCYKRNGQKTSVKFDFEVDQESATAVANELFEMVDLPREHLDDVTMKLVDIRKDFLAGVLATGQHVAPKPAMTPARPATPTNTPPVPGKQAAGAPTPYARVVHPSTAPAARASTTAMSSTARQPKADVAGQSSKVAGGAPSTAPQRRPVLSSTVATMARDTEEKFKRAIGNPNQVVQLQRHLGTDVAASSETLVRDAEVDKLDRMIVEEEERHRRIQQAHEARIADIKEKREAYQQQQAAGASKADGASAVVVPSTQYSMGKSASSIAAKVAKEMIASRSTATAATTTKPVAAPTKPKLNRSDSAGTTCSSKSVGGASVGSVGASTASANAPPAKARKSKKPDEAEIKDLEKKLESKLFWGDDSKTQISSSASAPVGSIRGSMSSSNLTRIMQNKQAQGVAVAMQQGNGTAGRPGSIGSAPGQPQLGGNPAMRGMMMNPMGNVTQQQEQSNGVSGSMGQVPPQ